MGVLVEAKDWTVGRVSVASEKVEAFGNDSADKLREAMTTLSKTYPCTFVAQSAQQVLSILNHISEFGPIKSVSSKTHDLLKMLLETLQGLLGALNSIITKPTEWIVIFITKVVSELGIVVYLVFEKVDVKLVTPAYNTVGNGVAACKNRIVLPVARRVKERVVYPICGRVSAIGCAGKSFAISAAAMVDNKVPISSLVGTVITRAQKLDDKVTKGFIGSTAVTLDSKLTNGSFANLLQSSVEEFRAQKAPANLSPVKPLKIVQTPNTTATGPPTYLPKV